MHDRTRHSLQSVASWALAAILFASSFFVSFEAPAFAQSVPKPSQASQALQELEEQAAGRVRDDQVVELVVTLSENADDYKTVGHAAMMSGVQLRSASNRAVQAEIAHQAQEETLQEIERQNIDFDVLYRLDLLMNGFTGSATYADAKRLAELPQVESVNIAVQYRIPVINASPLMAHSSGMVFADAAFGRGFDGKGTVIAVLDTGTDPEHRDMVLEGEDANAMALTQERVEQLLDAKELRGGKWFSNKIPFGYNYYSRDTHIKDDSPNASMHGMHVAGTVLANGNPAEGGIRGIAPKAQLLAMSVFGPSGTTSPVYYLPAIEDSVRLGADSINMSLGSPAGNVSQEGSSVVEAINKAREIGCVVNIAAGNEAQLGNGAGNPHADAPDYGVVGTPAVERGSLAVASINNIKATMKPIELLAEPEDGEHRYVAYNEGKTVPLVFDEEMEVVNGGIGRPEEIPDDANGKAVLIERGTLTFVEKINNAAAKGAKLAIIYNHEEGGNEFVNMATDNTTIPALSVQRDDGLYMLNYQGKIAVRENVVTVDYGTNHDMSDFSSWGLGSDGDLKPEITAPGGNIYSTLNNNEYGNMSGTSMATPHVAGGVAIVSARLKKDFAGVEGEARSMLVKNLLMSTAIPHIDHVDTGTSVYTSPRKQGAGVMDLNGATYGHVIAVDPSEGVSQGISKVVLGDLSEDTVTFSVELRNYRSEEVNYQASLQLNTDATEAGRFTLHPLFLKEEDLGAVTVPGGSPAQPGTKTVEVSFDASSFRTPLLQAMPNGYYLEGFVCFQSTDLEQEPNISVPFVGFRGNWNDIPVLEKAIYEFKDLSKDAPIYYDPSLEKDNIHFTHFFSNVQAERVVLGETTPEGASTRTFDRSRIAFSPNGDGKLDQLKLNTVFLRNGRNVALQIKNAQGEIVVPAGYGVSQTKHFYNGEPKNPRSYTSSSLWWDGSVRSKTAEDGRYQVEIVGRSEMAPSDAPLQNLGSYDVLLDTKPPVSENSSYDEATGKLTLNLVDGELGSGVRSVKVLLDGQEVKPQSDGTYQLPENTPMKKVRVEAEDRVYNGYVKPLEEVLFNLPKGKLLVEAKTDDGKSVDFTYEVYRILDDGTEEKIDLDPNQEYVLGKYKVKLISWSDTYFFDKEDTKEKTVTLTQEGESQTVSFSFLRDTRERRSVSIVSGPSYDAYTGERAFVATNLEDGKTYTFKQDPRYPDWYDAELPYGPYEFKPVSVPEGYMSVPEVHHVEVNAGYRGYSLILFQSVKEVGSIQPQSIAGDEGLEGLPQASDYEYLHVDVEVGFDTPERLPYGKYIVAPKKVPEGLFVLPAYQVVEVSAENPNAQPIFTYARKSEDRVGSLTVRFVDAENKPIEGKFSYTVENWEGEAQEDLSKLSYGTYFVRPDEAFGYKFDKTLKEAEISENSREATVTFQAERVNRSGQKSRVMILVNNSWLFPGFRDYKFTLTNVDGDVFTIAGSSPYSLNGEVPYDDYRIEAVNLPEGGYMEPEVLTKRINKPSTYLAVEFVQGVRQRTVVFDPQNGEELSTVQVDDKSPVAEPNAPVREGHRFLGWYTDAEATKAYDFSTPVTADLKLYAGWEKEQYEITLDAQNGTTPSTVSVTYGELLETPEAPTKEHFNFVGWYAEPEGTTAYDFNEPVKRAFTLYAKWAAKPVFDVTLHRQDGSEPSVVSVEDGAKLVLSEEVTREGYTFNGWFLDEEGTEPYNFDAAVHGPFDLYAQWTIRSYQVSFDPQNGEEPTAVSVNYGQTVEEPAAPEKEGFVFQGWSLDPVGKDVFSFETPIQAETRLYAIWVAQKPETVTVTFKANNGQPDVTVEVIKGQPVSEPADPTPRIESMVFDGWYTDAELTQPFAFDTPLEADLTLYARWKIESEDTPTPQEPTPQEPTPQEPDRPMMLLAKDAQGNLLGSVAAKASILGDATTLSIRPLEKTYDNLRAQAYSIELLDVAGHAVQPKGSVRVSLQIPEALRNEEGLQLFYDDGQTLLPVEGERVGQEFRFVTDHFSIYVLGARVEAKQPGSETPVTPDPGAKTPKPEGKAPSTAQTGSSTTSKSGSSAQGKASPTTGDLGPMSAVLFLSLAALSFFALRKKATDEK